MPCNDPDHMDEPCLCDCGDWFELNTGWLPPGETTGKLVCGKCYREMLEDCQKD